MTDDEVTAELEAHNFSSFFPKAYRLHFSCDNCGRLRPTTKRRITWKFGFTNVRALGDGKQGEELRGEEHEIELLWSTKSGKTRIVWNKKDISHLFRDQQRFECVRFCWESSAGEEFRIIAHARPSSSHAQYTLMIGDVEFATMPHVSELGQDGEGVEIVYDSESPGMLSMMARPISPMTVDDRDYAPQKLGGRPQFIDDLEDYLEADMHSSSLESLRQRVTELVPGTDDIVSRAIINAFSDERDSFSGSLDSETSHESMAERPIQVEVEALQETRNWLLQNVVNQSGPDMEEQRRDLLQKKMGQIFLLVRQLSLNEDEAARIIAEIATLVGMTVREPMERDTIVLDELVLHTSAEDVIQSLSGFGEIKEAAVATGDHFAICRFCDQEGVRLTLQAWSNRSLETNGVMPLVARLDQPLINLHAEPQCRENSEPVTSLTTPSSLTKKRSHQRNTVTIDTAIGETPFLGLVSSQSPVVTPDNPRPVLLPHAFTNIPARSTPGTFLNEMMAPPANFGRFSPTSMVLIE